METTVSEIHAYPLRPEGYAEPLFHDRVSRKRILDHFARGGWLSRASELKDSPPPAPLTSSTGIITKAVSEILASWREVDRWWEPDGGVDLTWRLVEDRAGRQEVRAEPVPEVPGCEAA